MAKRRRVLKKSSGGRRKGPMVEPPKYAGIPATRTSVEVFLVNLNQKKVEKIGRQGITGYAV